MPPEILELKEIFHKVKIKNLESLDSLLRAA